MAVSESNVEWAASGFRYSSPLELVPSALCSLWRPDEVPPNPYQIIRMLGVAKPRNMTAGTTSPNNIRRRFDLSTFIPLLRAKRSTALLILTSGSRLSPIRPYFRGSHRMLHAR